ncbi:MAG TPA: putative ATP-grasp-modified RiPP [Natronosporangium sp.]
MAGLFALGRPFGLLPTSQEVCDGETLPFGLRQAVESPAVPVGDLSSYGYDADRQIGVITENGRVVPLLRHTTGQTRTTTNPDGQAGPDSDTDYRED